MAIEKFADHASESFTMPEVCVKLRSMLDDGKHDLDDITQLIVSKPQREGVALG